MGKRKGELTKAQAVVAKELAEEKDRTREHDRVHKANLVLVRNCRRCESIGMSWEGRWR